MYLIATIYLFAVSKESIFNNKLRDKFTSCVMREKAV